jgi:hypothetical protein
MVKALLKGLVLVVGVVVSGCAVRYDHITFEHKDIVHKDTPYAFVIEETTIKDITRGGFGNKPLIGIDYTAEVSNCIAHAIRDKFPDANIIVSKDIWKTNKENLPVRNTQALQTGVIYIHNITDFSIRTGVVHNFVARFTADIKTNKRDFSIKAEGGIGVLPFTGSPKGATEKACKDFAEKLSNYIKK